MALGAFATLASELVRTGARSWSVGTLRWRRRLVG
jgi:hypothetical protein